MNFRMAPNSLFAILLRSPWWISLILAVLPFALASALLPAEWRVPAAAIGLPFLGLALTALWRQWRRPSAREVQALEQTLSALAWNAFADRLVRGFERQGYAVERVSGVADLRLARGGRHVLVAARRWKASRQGIEPLQALRQAAREEDAGGMVYVALGDLTPQARRYAEQERIEVLQAEGLAQLLRGS